MKNTIIGFILLVIFTQYVYSAAMEQGTYYVTSNRLNERLEPSKNGKITNTLDKGQKVKVYDVVNGWARITEWYDGIVEGQNKAVARWVFAMYLSKNKPVKKNVNYNSPIANAIKNSDDFSRYKSVFIKASEELVKSGRCSIRELSGDGWMRSQNQKPAPVYFVWCNGYKDRVYLNTRTADYW